MTHQHGSDTPPGFYDSGNCIIPFVYVVKADYSAGAITLMLHDNQTQRFTGNDADQFMEHYRAWLRQR